MISQQIVNGLMLGSIYALVAVSFTIAIGVLNFLNFSIPGIFMLAGMTTWALLAAGVPFVLVPVAVIAVGAMLSLVVERVTYRRMRLSDHFVPLVSSMAFLILFENLVLIGWGSDLQRVETPFASVSWRFGGLVVAVPQLLGLAAAVLAAVALAFVLKRTRFGRALRTVAEDSDTAVILGVGISRLVPLVFVVGGIFTALAGFLFALNYQQVGPFIGEEVALKGISAMVIGGMGNIWGAILGGLLIGVVEALSSHWFGARAVDIIVYGSLLTILFARPTGLLGGGAIQQARL